MKGLCFKVTFLLLAISGLFTITAAADSCMPLGMFSLNKPCNPQGLKIYGDSGTGQSVGTTQGLISGDSFQVGFDNQNNSAKDLLIVAAFYGNPVGGELNGITFNPLGSDPFTSQNGAIKDTLIGLNFATSQNFNANNLTYGWLDLNHGVAKGDKYTVNIANVAPGTIFFVESVNSYEVEVASHIVCDKYNKQGQCTKSHTETEDKEVDLIDHINAPSEGGVINRPPATPEPATLILLGSGLAGLALRRRKK